MPTVRHSPTFQPGSTPERVAAYFMLTLEGELGGVCMEVGGAFLTFMNRKGPVPDVAENRDALLALGLDWLQAQGFEVSIT